MSIARCPAAWRCVLASSSQIVALVRIRVRFEEPVVRESGSAFPAAPIGQDRGETARQVDEELSFSPWLAFAGACAPPPCQIDSVEVGPIDTPSSDFQQSHVPGFLSRADQSPDSPLAIAGKDRGDIRQWHFSSAHALAVPEKRELVQTCERFGG